MPKERIASPARRVTELWWLTAATCFAIVVLLGSCSPTESRHRELWRLPNGYEGWIYTRWNAAGCPPLGARDGYLVIDVPSSGVVCTSSPLEEGIASDRFVYVSADGKETEIPPSRAHSRVFQKGNFDLFVFIGTQEDFGRIRPSPPSNYVP